MSQILKNNIDFTFQAFNFLYAGLGILTLLTTMFCNTNVARGLLKMRNRYECVTHHIHNICVVRPGITLLLQIALFVLHAKNHSRLEGNFIKLVMQMKTGEPETEPILNKKHLFIS